MLKPAAKKARLWKVARSTALNFNPGAQGPISSSFFEGKDIEAGHRSLAQVQL